MPPLPIDAILPLVHQRLNARPNLVIEAPPGAGKTTRIPPALLSNSGQVLVLEPRRLAARLAARRVAEELGEPLGETVGFQVRFEEVSGPKTRLLFLTEGVLTRRVLRDPDLKQVHCVVLDEFHERHLEGDLALALLRRLQLTTRPDLRIVAMSATLDAAPLAQFLDCESLRSEGRLHPVETRFTPSSPWTLEEQVAQAVERCVAEQKEGHLLAFLPGAAEIRRAARACEQIASSAGLDVLPLYGDLPPQEQDRAVQPSSRRKLILSTNVAESSITIEGVTAVIDSGLARIAFDSRWTGLPTLEVQRISKASAQQRAGRAGRTAPGVAIRLFTAEDFHRRRDHDEPEIRRRELSQTLLELRALGMEELPWFEPPPAEAWARADQLLRDLHAERDAAQLAALPVHPRLGRLILEGKRNRVGYAACVAAALLSSNERLPHVDLLTAIDRERSPGVERILRQLSRIAQTRPERSSSDAALAQSLLRAFPDRVAQRRNDREVQLANGSFAALSEANFHAPFLLALDVQDRSDQPVPLVRLAVAIEPDWLLDAFPERVTARDEIFWNREAERVEQRSALLFDSLVLEESRSGKVDLQQAAPLLAAKALEAGVERFVDPEELESFLARVTFASQHSSIPKLEPKDLQEALARLAEGHRSFSELREAASNGGLVRVLRERLPQRELDEIAPERFPLKGRQVKIQYKVGQTPYIASRLQDFFGLTETPRIARGQVPLTLHLLAPNQRPVQTTTDLAGFWSRLYPQLRRELGRRYPRHAWPESPF
jgi:ATP-dependent helicase HrpB